MNRIIYIIIGSFSVALGALGIVLPVLPTTPFMLLALFCFTKGSPKMSEWLVNHKIFGRYIRDYMSGKPLSAKAVVWILSTLWLSLIASMYIVGNLWVVVILPIVGFCVTMHIINRAGVK